MHFAGLDCRYLCSAWIPWDCSVFVILFINYWAGMYYTARFSLPKYAHNIQLCTKSTVGLVFIASLLIANFKCSINLHIINIPPMQTLIIIFVVVWQITHPAPSPLGPSKSYFCFWSPARMLLAISRFSASSVVYIAHA